LRLLFPAKVLVVTNSDLAAQLQRIQDHLAIQTLVAKYAWHAARGEYEPLAKLFTADGLFISPSARPPAGTLAQFYATHLKPGLTIPMVTNHIIEIDGDSARGRCTMQSLWQGTGPGFVGFYEDEYRREGGEWRFTRRVFQYHQQPR
jgi:hypothetical protein